MPPGQGWSGDTKMPNPSDRYWPGYEIESHFRPGADCYTPTAWPLRQPPLLVVAPLWLESDQDRRAGLEALAAYAQEKKGRVAGLARQKAATIHRPGGYHQKLPNGNKHRHVSGHDN